MKPIITFLTFLTSSLAIVFFAQARVNVLCRMPMGGACFPYISVYLII